MDNSTVIRLLVIHHDFVAVFVYIDSIDVRFTCRNTWNVQDEGQRCGILCERFREIRAPYEITQYGKLRRYSESRIPNRNDQKCSVIQKT
ncbi:hypothetical protein RB195_020590 [Necator americanus]|uniref:Uncharacterized protein n=1 Tax=Necator americanus TaxID=51031 RepID=A0ABR1CJJ8_NECAM